MQLLSQNITKWMHNIGWNITGQTTFQNRRGMDVTEVSDFWAQHAINIAKAEMSVDVRVRPQSLLKFGETDNADSGLTTEVMNLPGATQRFETDAIGNSIDTISSESGLDNEVIRVEGHTLAGTDLTFVVQFATLNGQNKVVLATPLNKVSRLHALGAIDVNGPVYCYEDTPITGGAPSDDTKVHIMMVANENNSHKAKTSFSSTECGLITQVYAGIKRSAGSSVDVDVDLQIRDFGEVWRSIFPLTLRTASQPSTVIDLRPYVIIPSNADVRLIATSDASNVNVIGFFNALILTQ